MGKTKNPVYDKAYELYLLGLSLEQVAKELNVTRQCIFKAFKARGLSLRGKNFKPVQVYDGLKFTLRSNGYYALTTNNRSLMHRYVWNKEKGIIPNGFDIHHINGKRYDNRIENLECISKSEHTSLYSLNNNQFGKGHRPINMISSDGVILKRFKDTSTAAKELGITKGAICKNLNGKSKLCLNYKFEYADN